MPISWTLLEPECLVEATIAGAPTLAEFKTYIAEVTDAGGRGYAKLVDMRHAALDLRSAEIRDLAQVVLAQARRSGAALGPVAIVVDADSTREFTLLFDDRTAAANRPLSIFADRDTALAWLKAWQARSAQSSIASDPPSV